METLSELLVVFYVLIGVGFGGIALFNSIEDEELTKGRLITMIVFLPQTIIVGIFFTLIAAFVWVQDFFTHHSKLNRWWNSPVRVKKEEN